MTNATKTDLETVMEFAREHGNRADLMDNGTVRIALYWTMEDGTEGTDLEYVRTMPEAFAALGY